MTDKQRRAAIKKFFEEEPGYTLLIAGLIGIAAGAAAIFLIAETLVGLGLVAVGAGLVFLQFTLYGNESQGYATFVQQQRIDLKQIVLDAYEEINVDIDDLLNFDAEDVTGFDFEEKSGSQFDRILKKSVVLFGPVPFSKQRHFRRVKHGSKLLIASNPMQFSILFLTAERIIIHMGVWDFIVGDRDDTETKNIFLREIVGINTRLETQRFEKADHPKLFEAYSKATGKTPERIARSYHSITVSTTGGNQIVLPIGTPQFRDDEDSGDRETVTAQRTRYNAVARQLQERVEEAKHL